MVIGERMGPTSASKRNPPGSTEMEWGACGSGPGQFTHPHGIGIGPMGNVYLPETGNNRVQKFTSDGVFLLKWG